MVSVYTLSVGRILYIAAPILLLLFLAVGSISAAYIVLAISFILVLSALMYIKPLSNLFLIILSVFLINITFVVASPVRIANEIVNFTVIPVILVYLLLLPKRIQSHRHSNKYEKAIMLLLLFLFGWSALSFFWTRDAYHGVNVLLTFLVSIFVIQIVLFSIENKDALFKLLNVMPLVGLFLGILLVISNYYSEGEEIKLIRNVTLNIAIITDHDRPGGFAPPDLAASVMSIFIFINIALMYRANLLKRMALGLIVLFLVYCNFLTASKAGVGSLFIGGVLLLFTMPFFRNYLIRLSAALLIFIAPVLILGGKVLMKRIQLVVEKDVAGGGLGERLEWWKTGFDRLCETYGIGLGAGGFLRYIDPVPGAHNFYFSLLFDLGIIGLLIFIIIAIILINYIKKTLHICKDREMIFLIYCFIANLTAFCTQAFVEGDFQQTFFWLLVGLTLAVLKIATETTLCNS